MTALVTRPVSGEVLSAKDMVRVVARLVPLAGPRIDRLVLAGATVDECLEEALGMDASLDLIVDLLDAKSSIRLRRDDWRRVRPKPGTTLVARPAIQDGSTLRTVLLLAVVVATFFIAGPIAGALTAATGLTIGASLVAGVIIFAGGLLVNALFPVKQPDQVTDSFKRLNSIAGASNQASKFGQIPVVLGKHRMSPYYGAQYYTEIVGDDQYLNLLFVWGYGPLNITDVKIGETPIEAFEDVQVEHRHGYASDTEFTIFNSAVHEVPLSTKLAYANLEWGYGQTTEIDTDAFSFDLTAPNGVFNRDQTSGEYQQRPVGIQWRYRLVGSGDDAWVYGGEIDFIRELKTARYGAVAHPPVRGQYEIQWRRTNPEIPDDQNIVDEIDLTALRSFRNVPPISFDKPLAKTAIRIRATDQLNGTISTLNGIVESRVTAFSGLGSTWNTDTASHNPADLFRWVLQGPMMARPVTDDLIDLDNLQEWWAYCRDNGFAFNQVRENVASAYDALTDVATAGRAAPTFIDGKWGVIWDQPESTVVDHYSPRNSWGFQATKPIAKLPHAFRVSFINEENGYTQDERIVYDDGYNASNATLFEGIQFPGITTPDLAWRFGRFHIAQARLRPEEFILSVGWRNLISTRGDRVRVTHDVALIGMASGRVKAVAGQVITLDEIVQMESGKTYGIRFTNPDPDKFGLYRSVETIEGEYNQLTLLGDDAVPDVGDEFNFGEAEQESAVYRIKKIAHQRDLIAQLTLVDDAPEISTADEGTIPPYDPHVTLPVDPFSQAPQNLRYQETTQGQGDAVQAVTVFIWQAVRRGKIVASEVQYLDGASANRWRAVSTLPYPQFSIDIPLIAPGTWSFRVRFLFDDGTFSAWSTLSNLTLLGLSAAPPDVQNVRAAAYVDSNTSIAWDEVSDYRPVRYELRKGDSWETGLNLGTVAHPPFAAHGNGTYWVKAYVGPSASRAYSANAGSVTITGASLVRNVIAERDEAGNGWTGKFTGSVGKSGSLIRTGGAANILDEADFLGLPSILDLGGQGEGTYEIAEDRYVNNGRVAPCRVTITWKGTSQIVTDDMLANPDFLGNPDFLAVGAPGLVEVYPEISISQTGYIKDVFDLNAETNPANDIFAEPDVFSPDVSFGPWIKYEPGVYVGYVFRFRLVLKSLDPQVAAIALEFNITVDVLDRVDTWGLIGGVGTSLNGVTVPDTGLAIVFAPNGTETAAPFHGGPGTDLLPHVQITNGNGQTYDFTFDNLTTSGMTLFAKQSGVPVTAPKTNITIQGY